MKANEQVEEGRVAMLEREVRRLKRAMGAALLGAAVLASFTAARREPERVVEAEKLVLRDRSGNARATLSVEESDGAATLAFHDAEGRVRLRIGSRADGSAGFSLRDETGATRLTMSATAAGEPAFALQDGRGKPRLGFALSEEGAGFRLYDDEGRRRVVVGVAPRGVLLRLADAKEGARAELHVADDGPLLLLTDEAGKKVASLP